MKKLILAAVVGAFSTASAAQDVFEAESQIASGKFTTASEIKSILPYTKAQWIAVRPYEGNDLLYFTNILAWRCGMHEIRWAVNGGALQALDMEPCYLEEPTPNALKVVDGVLPYVTLPIQSVETVHIEILFDDLSTDAADYARADVEIN